MVGMGSQGWSRHKWGPVVGMRRYGAAAHCDHAYPRMRHTYLSPFTIVTPNIGEAGSGRGLWKEALAKVAVLGA